MEVTKFQETDNLNNYNKEFTHLTFETKQIIYDAIIDNKEELVESFIKTGELYLYLDEDGNTALHRAVFMDMDSIVHLILKNENEMPQIKDWINIKNNQGLQAIHYASYRGNIELIELLIQHNSEYSNVNYNGLNVIHMAAQGNQPQSIILFKEKYNMNINIIDRLGSTPLHWACFTGSDLVVSYLLMYGALMNIQDQEGHTPLHLSVVSGKYYKTNLNRKNKNYKKITIKRSKS